jgi:hypothetical protein
MVGQSAFAAGNPRLLAGPLMRNALGVRRFAATAGDLAQSGSIEQCESSQMFGGHGALVNQWVISLPGESHATPVVASARGRLAAEASSKRSACETWSAKAEPLVFSKITSGLAGSSSGRGESS